MAKVYCMQVEILLTASDIPTSGKTSQCSGCLAETVVILSLPCLQIHTAEAL